MVLMRMRDQHRIDGRGNVEGSRQEFSRSLRRIQRPTDIKNDAMPGSGADFDAIAADLMGGAMNGYVDSDQ